MTTIHKYKLEISDFQKLQMPADAALLTVQIQDGIPVMWAIVDDGAKNEDRYIEAFGTGKAITNLSDRYYIATCQLPDGIVLHFFEYLGL